MPYITENNFRWEMKPWIMARQQDCYRDIILVYG